MTLPALFSDAPRATRRDVSLVVLVGLLFFSLNVDFLLFGDAAVYADYVVLGKFDELTLHIGYYAVVWAAQHSLGALLHLPIEQTMVWVNVVCGALALGVFYTLALHFLGRRRDALLCVAILAVSGRVLDNATTAEMYMLQTLLVFTSYLLFVRERIVAAGVFAAGAMLVSPLSIFAFLFFPVYDYQRAGRIRWAVLAKLAAVALIAYLPYFVVFGRELLWGKRGLLSISGHRKFEPGRGLLQAVLYQFKAYTVLVLLVPAAVWAMRRHLRFLALTLAVVLPHLYLITKLLGEDNVFILNTDFFFACWLVLGWRAMAQDEGMRFLAPLPLGAHVAILWLSGAIFSFDSHREFANEVRHVVHTYVANRPAQVVTSWGAGVALTFLARERADTTVDAEPLFRRHVYDIESVDPTRPRPLRGTETYVLDSWRPTPLNRLFRSKESLEAQQRAASVLATAQRVLNLECALVESHTYRLYRCTPRAAAAGGS